MEKEPVNMTSRTHRRLKKAYCRLLMKTDAEKINVSTLTEEADVSRATFYLYYQNIDEFKKETTEYMIALFVRQICIFIESDRSKVREACSKRNLIFTEDDLSLFRCLFMNNRGFGFDKSEFRYVFDTLSSRVSERFSDKFIKKNKERFELFFIGYSAVMRDDFFDYHSDKTARDVLRSMDIWDILFPEHKVQN